MTSFISSPSADHASSPSLLTKRRFTPNFSSLPTKFGRAPSPVFDEQDQTSDSPSADDSFYDAPWADQNGLKRKVLGLDNISWRP